MGFFSKLRGIFSGRKAAASSGSGERKGFFERVRERREEKRIAREWERSQKRMEKMEQESLKQKAKRKAEERLEKKAAEQKSREYHERGRETFKDNWGFNDKEYDDFIQFIDGASDEIKEVFGSNNLVEAFRTGRTLGLTPDDMKAVLKQTYNDIDGGTQEDIVDSLYYNIYALSSNIEEGSHV